MNKALTLHVGVKTDPIEYRYSYEWLFRLLSEEGVWFVQLGTFSEMYQLPDAYFVELRRRAAEFGVRISSVFTAHRELGGFFRGEPGWEEVARRYYERLIQVGALVGADSVGSNPGTTLRDRMETKREGVACYVRHMKELMTYGRREGLQRLAIEPMSCLAEHPTLPEEIREMGETFLAHHRAHPNTTIPVGYCVDVAHGYASGNGEVVWSPLDLLRVALPYLVELHLKNTDRRFEATFGFAEEERQVGVVDIPAVVRLVIEEVGRLPTNELVGYLELSGPKLGRDYSDPLLEAQLRDSLRYLREVFRVQPTEPSRVRGHNPRETAG